MDELIGKTIVAAVEVANPGDDFDAWKVTCSDGSVYTVKSHGHAYCSSSLSVHRESSNGQ